MLVLKSLLVALTALTGVMSAPFDFLHEQDDIDNSTLIEKRAVTPNSEGKHATEVSNRLHDIFRNATPRRLGSQAHSDVADALRRFGHLRSSLRLSPGVTSFMISTLLTIFQVRTTATSTLSGRMAVEMSPTPTWRAAATLSIGEILATLSVAKDGIRGPEGMSDDTLIFGGYELT